MYEWTSSAAKRIRKLGESNNVDESIERIIERLLAGERKRPTDLQRLMETLGVSELVFDEDLVVPGELRRVADSLTIVLLPSLSEGRRRFTIAHELGHAIFESTGPGCPRKGRELERLCDKLAATMLMPRSLFVDFIGPTVTLSRLFEAVREFKVSLMSVVRRTCELYRVKAFEIDSGSVGWTYGMSNAMIAGALPSLSHVIEQAMAGSDGTRQVDIYVGANQSRWNLEWRILTPARRAVFLLTK